MDRRLKRRLQVDRVIDDVGVHQILVAVRERVDVPVLGEERPRQIQVAGGPGAIGAEVPDVSDDRIDVGVAQRVAEGRVAGGTSR